MIAPGSITLSYRLQRRDHAALVRALTRVTWKRLAIDTGLFAALVLVGVAIGAGSVEDAGDAIRQLVSLEAPGPLYGVFLIGPALSLLRPWLAGLTAASMFRSNAGADKIQVVTLTPDIVEARTDAASTQVNWRNVMRVIVTGRYLFLVNSRRGAFVIPRRTVPDKAEWRRITAFAQERQRTAAEAVSSGAS